MSKRANFKNIFIILFILVFIAVGEIVPETGTSRDKDQKSIPVWTFKEIGGNNKNGITIDPSPDVVSIVDINSKIVIIIDKDRVKQKALDLGGGSTVPPSVLSEITKITDILNQEVDILSMIEKEDIPLLSRGKPNRERLDKFSTAFLSILNFLESDPAMVNQVDDIYQKYPKDPVERYKAIFSLVSERIKSLQDQLRLSYSAFNFKMGAWLKNKSGEHPIHIENFDSYRNGEYYRVPFMTVPTSAEAQEQFKNIKDAADRFNKGGVSALFNIKENMVKLETYLRTELEASLSCIKKELTDSENTIKQDARDLKFPKTDTLISKIESIIKTVDQILAAINKLKANPADLQTQVGVISDIKDLLPQVEDGVKYIIKEFPNIKTEIETNGKALTNDIINTIEKGLDTISTTCFTGLNQFLDNTVDFISGLVDKFNNGLIIMNAQTKASLQLGDNVTSLMIDQIPERGTIALEYTGTRNEDDNVFIKAVLERKPAEGSVDNTPQQTVVGEKLFILYQILSVRVDPGLIFINPLKRTTDVAFKQTFQAAPSYSVRFEFGNRKSITYNRFLKIGVGFNVAALDFNLDSNYEIGLGFVVTALKDYLQVGIGHNLQTGNWYWFFGLQLPFGNLNFPVSGASK